MTRRRKILKLHLKRNERAEKLDVLAVDEPINLFINREHFVTLLASPKKIKELAIGHLLGWGVISALEDVRGIKVRGHDVQVETRKGIELETARSLKVIPTACGASEDLIVPLRNSKPLKIKRGVRFRVDEISNAFKSFRSKSKVFRKTGGTHIAALLTGDGMRSYAEDVGRNNAVDKVIGWGLLNHIDFSRSFVISSGRLSADIVIKCMRAGVPLVASKAAPLFSGVLAAKMGGLTLIGFTRGPMLNVYTHPERLTQ